LTTQDIDTKKVTTFRMSPAAQVILNEMSKRLGISQNATLEVLLRRIATQEKIKLEKD